MIDIRMKSKIPQAELDEKKGKIVTEGDSNILMTGPTKVRKPDGTLLAIYLPGVLMWDMDDAYETLTKIRLHTDNRGLASGSPRVKAGQTRTRAMPVMSGILGSMDPVGGMQYCRQTAWTGKESEKWEGLRPLWQSIATYFHEYVPDRFDKQMEYCQHTAPDWVIQGTPFTTITINNTYPTGVHTDKGDLDKGFSCLAVCRRGKYTGGIFTWPEYRLAVDTQDGDLILMDAHEWHGNTMIFCECGEQRNGLCKTCGAERISVVAYYRTEMFKCKTMNEENEKRLAYRERRKDDGEPEISEAEADAEALAAVTTPG